MIPGEIVTQAGEIELNAGRDSIEVEVANTGDRPIQVGSHYHFAETNPAPVKFALKELSILVSIAGDRRIFGFNAAVMGSLDHTS